jgi:predicted house-cleaning NTP pyrophosphatase (Maf/HAM1 superfamily)
VQVFEKLARNNVVGLPLLELNNVLESGRPELRPD